MAVYWNEVNSACRASLCFNGGGATSYCCVSAVVLYDKNANTGTTCTCEAKKTFLPYYKFNSACIRTNNGYECSASCVNYYVGCCLDQRLAYPGVVGQRYNADGTGGGGSWSTTSNFPLGFAWPVGVVCPDYNGCKTICLASGHNWRYINDPMRENAIAIGGVWTPVMAVCRVCSCMFDCCGARSSSYIDGNAPFYNSFAGCGCCLNCALSCNGVCVKLPSYGNNRSYLCCFAKNTYYGPLVTETRFADEFEMGQQVTLVPGGGIGQSFEFFQDVEEYNVAYTCALEYMAPQSAIFICQRCNCECCYYFKFRIYTPLDINFCACNQCDGWRQFYPTLNHTLHGNSYCYKHNNCHGFCNPFFEKNRHICSSKTGYTRAYAMSSACVRFNYNFNNSCWWPITTPYGCTATSCCVRISQNYSAGGLADYQMLCWSEPDGDGDMYVSWINCIQCTNAFGTGCRACDQAWILTNWSNNCNQICPAASSGNWANGVMNSTDPAVTTNLTHICSGGTSLPSCAYHNVRNNCYHCRMFAVYQSPELCIAYTGFCNNITAFSVIKLALADAMNKGMMWWHNKGYYQGMIARCTDAIGTLTTCPAGWCVSMYCSYNPEYLCWKQMGCGYMAVGRYGSHVQIPDLTY